MECLKKIQCILFVFEIDVFWYHKNLVYAATLSKYHRVMRWQFILKEFRPKNQHIDVVDNIIADALSILPFTILNRVEDSTSTALC